MKTCPLLFAAILLLWSVCVSEAGEEGQEKKRSAEEPQIKVLLTEREHKVGKRKVSKRSVERRAGEEGWEKKRATKEAVPGKPKKKPSTIGKMRRSGKKKVPKRSAEWRASDNPFRPLPAWDPSMCNGKYYCRTL